MICESDYRKLGFFFKILNYPPLLTLAFLKRTFGHFAKEQDLYKYGGPSAFIWIVW